MTPPGAPQTMNYRSINLHTETGENLYVRAYLPSINPIPLCFKQLYMGGNFNMWRKHRLGAFADI